MIIIILLSFSCKDEFRDQIRQDQDLVRDSINKTTEGKTSQIEYDKFEIITFEGCEYLVYKEQPSNNNSMGFMAHKGNCKNTIHCKTE